jgi:hypothetical protein
VHIENNRSEHHVEGGRVREGGGPHPPNECGGRAQWEFDVRLSIYIDNFTPCHTTFHAPFDFMICVLFSYTLACFNSFILFTIADTYADVQRRGSLSRPRAHRGEESKGERK